MIGSDNDVDKVLGNLSITNDILQNALGKLVGWDNRDLIHLLHGLIAESHKGAEMFMRLSIGEHLPPIPPVGAEIYVPINRMGWGVDEKEWTNSPFNENGYVKCSVLSTRAIHNYGPIEVQLPIWEKYPDPVRVRIELTDYKRADVLDFYQSDDQVQPRVSPF
jgi:hypothetical protein